MDQSVLVYAVNKRFAAVIASGRGARIFSEQRGDNDVWTVDYKMWPGVGSSVYDIAAAATISNSDGKGG